MTGLTSLSNSTARTRGRSFASWGAAVWASPRARPQTRRRGRKGRRKAISDAVRIVSACPSHALRPGAGFCFVRGSPASRFAPHDFAAPVFRLHPRGARLLGHGLRRGLAQAARRPASGVRLRPRRLGAAGSARPHGAASVQPGRPALARLGERLVPHAQRRPLERLARRAPRGRGRARRAAAPSARSRAGWKLGNPYWTGAARRIQYRVAARSRGCAPSSSGAP